ncbi:MAG TPA: chemotaxis protein CheW [Xanthomonadales bacterium]|nr:chemotaxis protein CheW [Xanthomonadales bacterium]
MIAADLAAPESVPAITGPFATLLEFERLSLAHRPGRPDLVQAEGHYRGVAYRIGGFRLVSDFSDILEILTVPAITPVPGADDWMLGIANVRGNLVPVVDLRRFLLGERSLVFDGQRMLLIRQQGGNVAVLVDEFFGQRGFVEDERIDAPTEQERYPRLTGFVARSYQVGGHDWSVFDLARLTRTPEFRQAAH